MPKLSGIIQRFFIQCILKLGISLAKNGIEIYVVADVVEVKWFTGIKNDDLFRKIPIMRVVETIFYKVSYKHPDFLRSLSPRSKHIRSDHWIF